MQNFIVILSWIFPIAGFIAPFVINHYMVKRKREEYKKDVTSLVRSLPIEEIETKQEIAKALVNRIVVVGMSQEMLLLAWGKPNSVDQRKQTQKYYQERWVYGVPRKGAGASYVTVKNGMIHEVLQNHRPRKAEGMGSVTVLLLALFGLIVGATISSWTGSFQF